MRKTRTKPTTKLNTKLIAKPDSKPSTKPISKPSTKQYSKPSTKAHSKPSTKPNKPNLEKQLSFTVAEENELLKFLLAVMPHKSRTHIKSLLEHGQISVDGEVTTLFNYPLLAGQKVFINSSKVYNKKSLPLGLKILFEDEHIIVIEKPAGMLSIATAREKDLTAFSILSAHVKEKDAQNRIFVVHRLDRETSGVMLFAKSEVIKKILQNAWKDVVLERSYAVVVEGRVTDDKGTIISWLKENKALRMYSSNIPNDGQKAVTHYRVLARSNSYSLLEVKLETGRKNQIRVHMQDLKHSIIGDIKYGGTKSPINRLGLHAKVLAFKHPRTDENVYFECPIPTQFLSMFKK